MLQIFKKDYKVTGKHSKMIEQLKALGFFEHYWQICVSAPLVGFIFKKKASPDRNDNIKPSTIFLSQLTPRYDDFDFIYKLILLSDESNAQASTDRIDKAFKYIYTEKTFEDEILFQNYLLGGIEILYEKLIGKDLDDENSEKIKLDANIDNLGKFIEEIALHDESILEEYGLNRQ